MTRPESPALTTLSVGWEPRQGIGPSQTIKKTSTAYGFIKPTLSHSGLWTGATPGRNQNMDSKRPDPVPPTEVPSQLRPEVRDFAHLMETKLRRHDATRGNEWRNMGMERLVARLVQEVEELRSLNRSGVAFQRLLTIHDECADIANFAMFIAIAHGHCPSAAHPKGESEPVAWRYRIEGHTGDWRYSNTCFAESGKKLIFQPLYTKGNE